MKSHLILTVAAPLLGLMLSACTSPGKTPASDSPSIVAPVAPEPRLSPEDLQADLDALYSGLEEAHVDLFARRPKAELDIEFARTRAALDHPMTRSDAQIVFQRFIAQARVAHARIDLPFERWAAYRTQGGRALPLFLRVDQGRVYAWNLPMALTGLAVGDEVVTVDGKPAMTFIDELGELVSADTDYMRHAQIERLVPMLVWLVKGDVEGVALGVRRSDNRIEPVYVASRTRAEIDAATAVNPSDVAPPSREFRLLGDDIAYLKPGPFYDDRPEAETPWGTTAFREFIDDAFAKALAANTTDLIIDLRDNPGGDNSFSDLMLAWIADKPFRFSPGFEIKVSRATTASNQARVDAAPADAGGASVDMAALFKGKNNGDRVMYPIPESPPREGTRFEGHVHVLVNRHTYSNATNVAAIIQDYGFGRILGEETSDLASTLGAMEQFTLPRSGLAVGYPKARILRPNRDPTPRGVVPDVTLPTPATKSTQDVVLDAATSLIRAGRVPPAKRDPPTS